MNSMKAMIRTRLLTVLAASLGLLFAGCDPDDREDKYARPDWLVGKVYTQLRDQPDLSTFALCLELTGYDTIVDRSGSYTVFAPTNVAFSEYLQAQSYNSVEDISPAVLSEIVKYHIVQNPWTKTQLRTLDVYGWIDTLDLRNNKPRGFKRQTLLLDRNRKLGVTQRQGGSLVVVDTTESNWHRIVATDSRKYAPIFFREYFDIYELNSEDYEFYFDRPFESSGDIYYAGGKIMGDEIFAENGFIYMIDRVVEPLPNAFQILESGGGGESFTDFLNLINMFPEFEYNEEKTFDQPGAEQGFQVDSLFDIFYPDLTFDILNEQTSPPSGTFGLPNNVTIRYHHGLVAPTDAAFEAFWNEYFVGSNRWNTISNTPDNILRILVNTHMSANPIYPTDFNHGFYNGEMDRVTLDPANIIDARFGSNCSFIGVDQAVVPRVFNSVAGPVYLLRGYSKVMYAVEEAGLLSALKREGEDYMFFVESNTNTSLDSSLIYMNGRFSLFTTGASVREYTINTSSLRTLIMNHIGVRNPTGAPRKEFIRNLTGNYLIVNNETGEISGTASTTIGYQGLVTQPNYPVMISTDADNGTTYDIENWFSFSATNIFQRIRSEFPHFHDLLMQAGLGNEFELRYTFLSENENYTVFVPTEPALAASGADTLQGDDLKDFLRFHFIQGSMIFTDGSSPPGYYETARVDERSTPFTTVFSKIYIDPGVDVIRIPDAQGTDYAVAEESGSTNLMAGRDVGEGTEVFRNLVITQVIHEIDRALIYQEVDTN